jgi:hypothetical protein
MKNEERKKIYSIDFDGTIAAPGKFPEIGKAIDKVVRYIYEIQNRHDKWILLTNREGDDLDKAMIWLAERGLYPDAVNDNLPEMQKFFRRNPRKVFANVMIDDLNAGGVYLPPLDGGMDFGSAIRALKDGKKVARKNWNGKGQYVFLADSVGFHTFADLSDSKDVKETHDMLVIKTSNNVFQPGWLATQSDMLAEDWMIVE